MGYYINKLNGAYLPAHGKSRAFKEAGYELIPPPTEWKEGLVCVVDNFIFEAAAYAFSEEEMNAFLEDNSGRPMKWFLIPEAKELVD